MIKKHSFTWRKGIVFSATFLLIALVSVSCKKKESQLGLNNIDQGDILSSSGLDTFSLITYTVVEDSTITKNNALSLLGSYYDPTFGMVKGEIYTQLHIQSISPDFGDLSTIAVDSFVLGLVYSGHYGKLGDQTIEVFEIDEPDGIINNDDSSYYQFSSVSSNELENWVVPGEEVIYMDPDNTTIIDSIEVPSQLRIPLDTNKAKIFMQDAAAQPASFESVDAFSDYFKGLHIRSANVGQNSGDGGVFYFNLTTASSKMTIYYTQDGVKKTYDFYIGSETVYFNNVDMDNSMTRVQDVIDNPSQGQVEYYAQAFKSLAAIEMPSVSNIPSNVVLHSAVVNLSVSHQTGTDYDPAGPIIVVRDDPDNPGKFVAIGQAIYSSTNKQYSFDLRYHIQRVISGELENTPLYVKPLFSNSTADRIIFNGPETVNKKAPSLRILYTEF